MIDVHCHIDMYPDPTQIIRECDDRGIVTIGMTNLPSHFELGYQHLLASNSCRLALGMHPLYAEFHKNEFPLFVKNLPKTSYVGEIGLDFSKEGFATKQLQLITFNKILETVSEERKILSLHSRRAEREVLDLLLKYKIKNAIFHWYSGPASLIDEIANSGYYFSVNSAMTVSTSGQKIIKKIPLNRMLTETDGPFVQLFDREVRPIDIEHIEKGIGSIINIPPEQIAESVRNNFRLLISQIK